MEMKKLLVALSIMTCPAYAYDDYDLGIPDFPGEYLIQSVQSSLCLDIEAASEKENANVQQYRCKGSSNQRFRIQPIIFDDALYVTFQNVKSGRSLTIDPGTLGRRSDNIVQKLQTVYTNEEVVLWQLDYVQADAFMIRSFDWHAGCLDIENASMEQKANVQVFQDCHEGPNQLFRLIPIF
jgi:hypothetical protein